MNKEIHIKSKSEASKGTIVFCHGFASSTNIFLDFYKKYLSDYDLHSVELPYMGNSDDKLSTNISIKSYAEYVCNFIERKKLQKVILIGHSLGGAIVNAICNLKPNLIRTSIMISSHNSVFTTNIVNTLRLVTYKNMDDVKDLQKYIYHDPKKVLGDNYDQEMNKIFNHLMANKKLFKKIYWKLAHPLNFGDARKFEVSNPITSLWIFPTKDLLIDPKASFAHITKMNPRFTVSLLEDSGHVPMHENPKELSNQINKWLETH